MYVGPVGQLFIQSINSNYYIIISLSPYMYVRKLNFFLHYASCIQNNIFTYKPDYHITMIQVVIRTLYHITSNIEHQLNYQCNYYTSPYIETISVMFLHCHRQVV